MYLHLEASPAGAHSYSAFPADVVPSQMQPQGLQGERLRACIDMSYALFPRGCLPSASLSVSPSPAPAGSSLPNSFSPWFEQGAEGRHLAFVMGGPRWGGLCHCCMPPSASGVRANLLSVFETGNQPPRKWHHSDFADEPIGTYRSHLPRLLQQVSRKLSGCCK